MSVGKKLSLNEVINLFKENGLQLLDQVYINSKTKMSFICSCGSKEVTTVDMLKRGINSCGRCGTKRKITIEFIEQNFNKNGCKLLSTYYTNSQQLLEYVCECGELSKVRFHDFEKGNRCKKCAYRKNGEKKRLSYEYVKNYFEENGCKLLTDTYINSNQKLKYICNCGMESEIIFSSFKTGRRCKECGYKKAGEKQSFDFTYVQQYFKENDCELIDDHYENGRQKLNYICSCGNKSVITFESFRNGHRCRMCGIEKYSSQLRLDYDYVKNYFHNNGCTLISKEYKNNLQKLEYICTCGTKDTRDFSSFSQGFRCKNCKSKNYSDFQKGRIYPNRRGENHPNWDFNKTQEEREQARKYSEYKDWRNEVYKRDKYTCQCCGDNRGGNLNAHHLDGYDWCVEKRIDTDNGITLCDTCHTNFHKMYGYGGNTEQQFEMYLTLIKHNVS